MKMRHQERLVWSNVFTINRMLLKLCHLFGYRLNEEHIDDITINISTKYNLYISEIQYFNKCESNEAKSILEDIFRQVYIQLENNKKLEKCCRNVKQVYVTYYQSDDHRGGSIITIIPYIDGILYNPFDRSVMSALNRERTINSLLS